MFLSRIICLLFSWVGVKHGAGKKPPEKTSGKAALREWSGPESSEDTGADCALALALKCGSRGLLFRPIERTHSEKEVMVS